MKRSSRRLAIAAIALSVTSVGAPALPTAGTDDGLPDFKGGPTHFVTLSDGTSIALNVVFPKSFDPENVYDAETGEGGYPVILEMAGYENGSSDALR